MLCWILAFYDGGAVHYCERKVQSNTQVCLLKRAWAFYMKPVILFEILGSYLFLHIWENILLKLGK